MLVSTTNTPVPISLTPTPYVVAPVDEFQRSVTLLLLCVGPGLLVVPGVGFVGVAGAAPAEPMPAPAKRSSAEIMTGNFTKVALVGSNDAFGLRRPERTNRRTLGLPFN